MKFMIFVFYIALDLFNKLLLMGSISFCVLRVSFSFNAQVFRDKYAKFSSINTVHRVRL